MGKHKKEKSKKKKRKRSRSPSSSSDSEKYMKKKRKKDKKSKSELPSIDDIIKERLKTKKIESADNPCSSKSFTPMTKEEYDKKQSVVRRVFDEDTGRMRLVKGDGEIIEEIVSAARQKEINKLATQGDGQSFQANLNSRLKD